MQNNSNIAQALTGDNSILTLNLQKIADDAMRYKMSFGELFQQIASLASQGILTTGDYYIFKDKAEAMKKLIATT